MTSALTATVLSPDDELSHGGNRPVTSAPPIHSPVQGLGFTQASTPRWEWEEAVPRSHLQDMVEKGGGVGRGGRGMGSRGKRGAGGGHLKKRGCSIKSPCGGLSLPELRGVGKG